jgi:hypothetical protein
VFFSPGFLDEAEYCSPFRLAFLRAPHKRLTSRQALYAVLFDAFLEARDSDDSDHPLPELRRLACFQADGEPAMGKNRQ